MKDENGRHIFRTPYNGHLFPSDDETNFGPSKTVPDQSMTLRTILERYAKGLPIEGQDKIPMYYGEEQIPDPTRMDFAEIQEYRENLLEKINSMEELVKHYHTPPQVEPITNQIKQDKNEKINSQTDPKAGL